MCYVSMGTLCHTGRGVGVEGEEGNSGRGGGVTAAGEYF